MSKPPRRAKIDGNFVEIGTDWTVARVRSALNLHEQGKFRQSSRLADAMGREPRIAKARNKRVAALSSRSALPFSVTPSEEGDGRKRSAAAKRQAEIWWDVCPESVIAPIQNDTLAMGMGLGYLDWSTTGEWMPRLNWLPTHGLAFEQYALDGERRPCWIYTDYTGVRHEVTPGDGRWFLHLPAGPRSWMSGFVRSLGLPWFAAVCTDRDWSRFNEKHWLPILSVDEPFFASDDVEGEDGAEGSAAAAYYEQFKNLGAESVLRNPQGQEKDQGGWSAKWLEPESESWSSFEAQLKYLGQLFDQAITGNDGTGSKGGDGELASERVASMYLSSDAETLSSSLREQVWKPWAEYNYGDRDVAGWGRWDTRPAPDMASRATTLKTMAEAIEILAPMKVDCAPP